MKTPEVKTIVEEHVTLVKEPGSEYIGHLSLSSGKAFNVCAKLVECLEAKHIDFDKLNAIGCDRTAVNTRNKGGVIRCLKTKLGRSL